MEKLSLDPCPHFLIHAVAQISKRAFSAEERRGLLGNQDLAKLWIKWWQSGPAEVEEQMKTRAGRWRQMKTGDTVPLWTLEVVYLDPAHQLRTQRKALTPAGEAYQAIQDLGIAILPLLVERFKQGDYEFVDMARELTDNKPPLPPEIPPTAEGKAKAFLAWWEENQAQWTIPWPEQSTP